MSAVVSLPGVAEIVQRAWDLQDLLTGKLSCNNDDGATRCSSLFSSANRRKPTGHTPG